MEERRDETELSDEDLRAALRGMKSFVDITEEDLGKIFALAMAHARQRMAFGGPVRDVMTVSVITASPEAGVREAAQLLSENRISGLPVTDKDRRVLGVVTEADILALTGMKREHTFLDIIRHLLGEPVPHKTGSTVGDVMTSPAITIGPDAGMGEAARIMDERRIKRLPVVGDDGKLIGLISRADIVRAVGRR
ncbi:MAG: CBS domain-containing protein [Nitrospiraceae bacterium]|nr:CBS domain-containing protein [Nitrospiraceae bacterium]